jgi:hypothetical protein
MRDFESFNPDFHKDASLKKSKESLLNSMKTQDIAHIIGSIKSPEDLKIAVNMIASEQSELFYE